MKYKNGRKAEVGDLVFFANASGKLQMDQVTELAGEAHLVLKHSGRRPAAECVHKDDDYQGLLRPPAPPAKSPPAK